MTLFEFFVHKFERQARKRGVRHAALNLKKQGVPFETALTIARKALGGPRTLTPCMYCDVDDESPLQRWSTCRQTGRCWERFESAIGAIGYRPPAAVLKS